MRTWEFYLAYCEAAFARRSTDVVQYTLRQPRSALRVALALLVGGAPCWPQVPPHVGRRCSSCRARAGGQRSAARGSAFTSTTPLFVDPAGFDPRRRSSACRSRSSCATRAHCAAARSPSASIEEMRRARCRYEPTTAQRWLAGDAGALPRRARRATHRRRAPARRRRALLLQRPVRSAKSAIPRSRAAFFAIWLDARTAAPDLRASLLTGAVTPWPSSTAGMRASADDLPGTAAAYGLLGLPLAFVALPLYVLLPNHYATRARRAARRARRGAAGGAPARCLRRPAGRRWVDRSRCAHRAPRAGVGAGRAVLAVGSVLLFFPAGDGSAALRAWRAWLAVTLIAATYSVRSASIAHQSWGARLGGDATRRAASRPGARASALVGVLIARVLPRWPG